MRDTPIDRRKFMGILGGLGSTLYLPGLSLGAEHSTTITAAGLDGGLPQSGEPFSIHPENSKYFIFRGKPRVLIAATEHYGSIINRRFDFARYLADAADKKQTVTRTFLLYREQQTSRNPYSPLKAESPDFVTPYPRTGPGKAMDGELKYDLDKWNPEYFDRLHRFLSLASDLGIVAELTVFSNTYGDSTWALNPLRDKNNLQGIGKGDWADYNSLRDPQLLERQTAYARKIVQETSAYDNIYYEICNEPGGGRPDHATVEEVDAWQAKMAEVIREELRQLHRQHLVFGQRAFSYAPHFYQNFDASFADPMLDAVNVHPLSHLIYQGRTYQLSRFMSEELQLGEFRDFFLAAYPERKPVISDEDNAASMYRDETGWTIHRKRAWMAVLCGSHYDYIDFSIEAGAEAGTAESSRCIRTWMKILSEFIHAYDFVRAKPLPGWIENPPAPLVAGALAKLGADYVAYLADGREVSDPEAGRPVAGTLTFSLPAGRYTVRFFSPRTGLYSPGVRVNGGDHISLDMTPFEHDIVLRATREA